MTAASDNLLRPAFALVWVYSMVTTLGWAALLPVLPLYVQGPLDGGDLAVGVVMSGALLVAACSQPVLGRLADRRGRRVLLVGGPIVFGLCVSTFSLADGPAELFALRAAAALGDAAFVVGAITVVNDLAPETRRGEAYSVYSISSWAGMGLGPVLGDVVLRTFSYSAVWLLCAVLTLGGALLAWFLPETRQTPAESSRRAGLLNPSAVGPGLVLALEMFGFVALVVFTPLYARELGMAGAGLVLLVNAAVLLTIRVFGRKLPDRLGARRAAAAGVAFTALGTAVPAVLTEPAGLYLGAAAFGTGHALLYPALFVLAVARAEAHARSSALGTLKACEAVGFALGAVALGFVASRAGYPAAYAVAAVATGAGLAPLLLASARRRVVAALRRT